MLNPLRRLRDAVRARHKRLDEMATERVREEDCTEFLYGLTISPSSVEEYMLSKDHKVEPFTPAGKNQGIAIIVHERYGQAARSPMDLFIGYERKREMMIGDWRELRDAKVVAIAGAQREQFRYGLFIGKAIYYGTPMRQSEDLRSED